MRPHRPKCLEPSRSFWTPSALEGSQPFHATLSLAKMLAPLTPRQIIALREAEARPWDGPLQAAIQARLREEAPTETFPAPRAETTASIRDARRLRDAWVAFLPRDLVRNSLADAVLEEHFIYRGDTVGRDGPVGVYASHRLISHHELVVCQSGGGKTVRGQQIFLGARRHGRWAFVMAKSEEWEPLIPALQAQNARPAMPPADAWRVNPLAPFGSPTRSREHFVQLFKQVEELPTYSADVLDGVVDEIYDRFGAYSRSLPLPVNPTLTDVIKAVEKLDSKHAPLAVRSTLVTRLRSWRRLFGDWAVPWPIDELARRTVIFPMSDLNEKSSRVAIERLQGPLLALREKQRTKDRTVLMFEEGRLVFTGDSLLAESISLARAEGISVYCMVQSTRDLNKTLLENSGIRSLGPVGHPAITKQMQAAMGLTSDQVDALRDQPVGTFCERYLYGHTTPLLVRMPYIRLRRPSDQELHEARHALDDLHTVTRDDAHRIDVVDSPESALDARALRFLQEIHENPYRPTTELYSDLQINPRVGNDLKRALVGSGLVHEHPVPMGRGGRPVLLDLTPAGQRALGVEVGRRQVIHRYAQQLLQEHLERLGATVELELRGTDVALELSGRRIAVEVEASGTNAAENLRRNVAEGYRDIVIVGVGSTVVKRVRRALRGALRELPEARVTFTTLGAAVKSDRAFWFGAAKSDEAAEKLDSPISS